MKLKSITYDSINDKLLVVVETIRYGKNPARVLNGLPIGEAIIFNQSGIDNQCSLICCNEASEISVKFNADDFKFENTTAEPGYRSVNGNSVVTNKESVDEVYVYNPDGTAISVPASDRYKWTILTTFKVDLSTSFIKAKEDLMFVFITLRNNTIEGIPTETFVFPYYLPTEYNKLILSGIKNTFVTDCCKGLNSCMLNHLLAKYGFEYAFNLRDCKTMVKYWNILHENNNTKSTSSGCGCGR